MGFYGAAKSAIKANLQIDIHYSNRAAMEKTLNSKEGDGVYAGRYVMVEYGIVRPEDLLLIYEKNGLFFLTTEHLKNNGPVFTATNDVMYRVAKNYTPGDKTLDIEIYVGDTSLTSTLRRANDKDLENPYLSNYLIDKAQWPEMGKGYDSTVWQKIYENGVPKYINIADLNSVVPTFGIKVDAPSQIPKAPHFDANLTNIYYDLHLQPAWGFRVKQAAKEESDCDTSHVRIGTDGSILPDTETVPAAIYFNKAAFDAQINSESIKKHSTVLTDNVIKLEEVSSGRKYSSQHNPENNSTALTEQNDIQELTIHLPAIGNMMSDAWDIIHGENRDNDAANSLQGRLDFFKEGLKANEIPLQSSGQYLVGATPKGDTWIDVAANALTKTISIAHKVPDSKTSLVGTENAQTPKFGKTFNIPYVKYDSKGHIYSGGSTTVTIPEIAVAAAPTPSDNNASVLTGLGWDATADEITFSEQNAGSLLLTGYATDSSTSTQTLAATDSLNKALAKLEQNIKLEKARAEAAETTLTNTINGLDLIDSATDSQVVTLVNETNGQIAVTHKDIGGLKLTGYTLPTSLSGMGITATHSLNEAIGRLEYGINDEIQAARAAELALGQRIDSLVLTDTENNTEIITSVSQNKGQLAVKRAAAGTLQLKGYTTPAGGVVKQNDSLEAAFSALDTALAGEAIRAKAAEDNLQTQITLLTNNTDEGLNSVVELVNWVTAHGTEAATMTENITKVTATADSNKATLDTLSPQVGTNTSGITSLEGRMTSVEALAGDAFNTTTELELILDDQTEPIVGTLNTLLTTLYNKISLLEAQIAELTTPEDETLPEEPESPESEEPTE